MLRHKLANGENNHSYKVKVALFFLAQLLSQAKYKTFIYIQLCDYFTASYVVDLSSHIINKKYYTFAMLWAAVVSCATDERDTVAVSLLKTELSKL